MHHVCDRCHFGGSFYADFDPLLVSSARPDQTFLPHEHSICV